MAEKSLNDIPRALREQFDRGMAAYNKQNLDYAITLFTDVLQKEPAFYDCREALRAAQFRKGGKGPGLFKKFLGQASPVLAKAQIALRTNPPEALHCAEEVLNEDPKNHAAHELLARAAMNIGLPRTAVLSLEIVFKANPGDRGVAIRLAQALVAAGQVARADKIYSDLLASNPADLEVARAYKDLGARRTIHEKGYAEFGSSDASYRNALKDKEEAVTLEQEQRTVKAEDVSQRLLDDHEERLAREPGNLKVLRNIADLHAQAGRLGHRVDQPPEGRTARQREVAALGKERRWHMAGVQPLELPRQRRREQTGGIDHRGGSQLRAVIRYQNHSA